MAVHDLRFATRSQLQAFFGIRRVNNANRVLSRLYQHGILQRLYLPVVFGEGNREAVYMLDEKGADWVAEMTGEERSNIRWKAYHNMVKSPYIEHNIEVNTARIAFTLAAEKHGWEIVRSVDQFQLHSWRLEERVTISVIDEKGKDDEKEVSVVGDWFFTLGLGNAWPNFFLEWDRAQVSNPRWAERTQAYLEYLHGDKFYERYRSRNFRVLTIAPSRRLRNLKKTTEEAGGRKVFWFAPQEEFTIVDGKLMVDPYLDPIWEKASEEGRHVLIRP